MLILDGLRSEEEDKFQIIPIRHETKPEVYIEEYNDHVGMLENSNMVILDEIKLPLTSAAEKEVSEFTQFFTSSDIRRMTLSRCLTHFN